MDLDLDKFLRALAADRETVLQFLGDIAPPTKPVEDYITDLDQRCVLFAETQQLHQDDGFPSLNAATLGFFMVAPLSEIQKHLETVRNIDRRFRGWMPDYINLCAPSAIKSYIPPNRTWPSVESVPLPSLNTNTTPGNHDDIARNEAVALIAKERDGNVCLLSGTSDPETTPIFPPRGESTRFYQLNTLLDFFWGSEKALTWRKLYEDPTITQSPANYLSLNHQFHFWFNTARFALKPLSQTPTTITLQFHWLRRASLLPMTLINVSGDMILDLAGLRTPSGPKTWGSCLAHRASGVPLRTGQTFVIRADHPKELPSFELLELRWNLARVAAICGAADDETNDDDEELLRYLGTMG